MGFTKIYDPDVALGAGIKTDKCDDSGQSNKFITQQDSDNLTVLTGGGNADGLHWHSGFGALAIQFGRNGITAAGQSLWANGIPSNIVGIPVSVRGAILSVAVATAESVAGPDFKIRVTADNLGTPVEVSIPAGQRKAAVSGLTHRFFNELDEIKCKVVQGQADKPSVLVEIRWRD